MPSYVFRYVNDDGAWWREDHELPDDQAAREAAREVAKDVFSNVEIWADLFYGTRAYVGRVAPVSLA